MPYQRMIITYDFDELTEKAKNFAINEQIEFMMETTDYEQGSAEFKKAIDEADNMRTPWFTGEYIWEHCKDEILEELKKFEFFGDGKVFCHKDYWEQI